MWRAKDDTNERDLSLSIDNGCCGEPTQNESTTTSSSVTDTVSTLGFHGDNMNGKKSTKGLRNVHRNRIEMKGRQKEREILQHAYERVVTGGSELIVVTGSSGSGKTTLVESLRKPVSLEGRGYYVCGKFDQLFANDRPYSAIVDAFTDIIDLIMMSNDIESRKETIKNALGSEVTLMCNLLSNLQYLTGTPLDYDGDDFENNMRQAFLRFKLLCRKFIRVLATEEHPLVIVFDDVQWSDQASLDVIKYLASDPESHHVLILTSLRSYSVNLEELLAVEQQQQEQAIVKRSKDSPPETNSMRTTLVEIHSLDLRGLNNLVAAALSEDPERTMALSEVVMKRTAGNPYFALQFLENLEADCLLTYDLQYKQWLWNIEKILASTTLSDNILQIVATKIGRLDVSVQRVLHIASCLSYQCDLATLEKAVGEVKSLHHLNLDHNLPFVDENSSHSNFERMVNFACEEGIIERPSKTEYKFTHDRVRESLYYMIGSENERQTLHLRIGRLLESLAKKTDIPSEHATLTLLSVEQLNHGANLIEDFAEVLHLVHLNRDAGKLAAKKGLYVSAAQYFRHGLSLLDPETRWSAFYNLTLEISTSLVEMETSAGLFDQSKATAKDIITHAGSFEEKVRAYNSLIESLYLDDDIRYAYDLCRTLLPQLGVKLPQKACLQHIAVDLVKTKFAARRLSKRAFASGSTTITTDPRNLCIMKMLASMACCSLLLQENEFLAVALLRMMKITSSVGISEFSPMGFSGYGILLASLGRHSEAEMLGEEALRLVTVLNAKLIGARTMTIASHYCLHWRRPIRAEVELNMEAYTFAMETGDLDSAFIAAQTYVSFCFYAGIPLETCEQKGATLMQQMVEFNQKTWLNLTVPYLQMFLNFMGHADDTSILTGDVMNQAEMESAMTESNNVMALNTIWLAQLYLSAFFEDTPLGLEIVKRLETNAEQAAGHLNYYEYKFVAALTYQGAYRLQRNNGSSSMRHRYKHAAKKIIKRFEKFAKDGCVNVVPLLAILKAEQMSCFTGNCKQIYTQELRAAYDNAIVEARNANLLQYEALATEKAGLVLLELQFEQQEAVAYLSRAIELYMKWGACEKAGRLENTRKELVSRYKMDEHTAKTVPTLLYAEF
jgi:histidine kinase